MIELNQIAKLVGGTVIGDGKVGVSGVASCANATENDITYVVDEKGLNQAAKSRAGCVLMTLEVDNYEKTVLKVDDIKTAVTVIYNIISENPAPREGGIHSSAIISESADIGKSVTVGPHAVIGKNVRIGENTVIGANCVLGDNVSVGKFTILYPNISVYDSSLIGNKVIIHSGTVIGSDGFGFMPKGDKIYKVPQLGRVVIEDEVELGSNTSIDRGTFDDTIIGKRSKIDNLTQIAHNAKVGKNVLMAAQTGISGSSTIGDNTIMGGKSGVVDHVHIGRDVKVAAKTGVTKNVPDGQTVSGFPHREAREERKFWGIMSLLIKHSRKFRTFLRNLPE